MKLFPRYAQLVCFVIDNSRMLTVLELQLGKEASFYKPVLQQLDDQAFREK